jgi:hypothetical protein
MTMDDFRIGSVPAPEPYGEHHPYGSVERRRQRHHHEEHGEEEEPTDTFEATPSEETPPSGGEQVEDYYRPSEASEDE